MMNIIKYYFPCPKYYDKKKCNDVYKKLLSKVQFSHDSITFMTKKVDAKIITMIIISHLNQLNLDHKKIIITDATAGIGGNTLSFAQFFNKINSVEINYKTFMMLRKNIDTYRFTNVHLYNYDYIKVSNNIEQNIVFIDPPWGGKDYKKHDIITLYLSQIKIEKICIQLLKKNNMVVLKLPLNYDFLHIYGIIHKTNIKIYVHELPKMFILFIHKTK